VRLRSKADATRVLTGAVLNDVVFAAAGQDGRREPEHLSLYDYSIPSAQPQWVQGLPPIADIQRDQAMARCFYESTP